MNTPCIPGSQAIESPKVGNGEPPGTTAAQEMCSVFNRRRVPFTTGANTALRSGTSTRQSVYQGLEAAGSQLRRFENFQFHRGICTRSHLGRVRVGLSRRRETLGKSLVACSTASAHVCRSTCRDTRLGDTEGQDLAAVWTCLARMYSKPPRVSGWPRALTTTSGANTGPTHPEPRAQGRNCDSGRFSSTHPPERHDVRCRRLAPAVGPHDFTVDGPAPVEGDWRQPAESLADPIRASAGVEIHPGQQSRGVLPTSPDSRSGAPAFNNPDIVETAVDQ